MLLQLLSEYINRSKIIAKVAILSSNMMQTSRSKDTVKMAKNGPFMAQTWAAIGPTYWPILNLKNKAHGCYMQIFRVLV